MQRPTRTALKSARLRVETLRAELVAPETTRLGKAAVASVQRSLDDAEWQLAQIDIAAAAPAARRDRDNAETVDAPASPEALAQAALLSGLRTSMAVVSGALFGFGALSGV